MLKVPGRRQRANAVDVRLTVSRVSDGAIEVAISTPGRLKTARLAGQADGRNAKPAAMKRASTVDKKRSRDPR